VQEAYVDYVDQMAVAAEDADGVEEPMSAAAAQGSNQHRTQHDSQETQKGLRKAHRKGRNDGMTLSEVRRWALSRTASPAVASGVGKRGIYRPRVVRQLHSHLISSLTLHIPNNRWTRTR